MITYSDMIENLTTFLGGGADDRQQSHIRLAVYDAYRRVTQHPKGWRYYIVRSRVNLNGMVSTGTVAYTASTRTFTLSGSTFPSWTVSGAIRIGSRNYEVETNPTSTTLTIDTTNAPVSDIAAGTSYQLVRYNYRLPADFQDVYWVEDDNTWTQSYVTPHQWYALDKTSMSVGSPSYWTILGDTSPGMYGRKAFNVFPAPSTSSPYEFLMRRRPRDIRLSGQSSTETAGTIAVSSGSTTVTGTNTAFGSRMIGSVMRFTDSTTLCPNGLGGLEPYTEEHVIADVTNATTLTLATAVGSAYSGTKYRITDPLDIDDCMETAVRSAAIYEIARNRNETDADTQRQRQTYIEELMRAWEIDQTRGIDRCGIPFYNDAPDTSDSNFQVS